MITVVLLFSAPTSATICMRRNFYSAAGFPTHQLRCFRQFLGSLQFGVRLDDAGALLLHRFSFHGHDLAAYPEESPRPSSPAIRDRDSPGSDVLDYVLAQDPLIDLVAGLQNFVQDHAGRLRFAAPVSATCWTAMREILHIQNGFLRVADAIPEHAQAFTFTVTLSRVMVSCCSMGVGDHAQVDSGFRFRYPAESARTGRGRAARYSVPIETQTARWYSLAHPQKPDSRTNSTTNTTRPVKFILRKARIVTQTRHERRHALTTQQIQAS